MSTFVSTLPARLRNKAFEWHGELAWSRTDAIEVISHLEQDRRAVLGVEIWIPSPSGPIVPTPFVYDWGLERSRRHAGSAKTALDFVRTFAWDPSDIAFRSREPYFNLVVADN